MSAKKHASRRSLKSDLARVDAHSVKPEEYKELPELTEEMLARAKINEGGRPGAARRGARAGDRKLSAPVTFFAAIEAEQHQALREIAFSERRSLDDVVREALAGFISQHPARRRLAAAKR